MVQMQHSTTTCLFFVLPSFKSVVAVSHCRLTLWSRIHDQFQLSLHPLLQFLHSTPSYDFTLQIPTIGQGSSHNTPRGNLVCSAPTTATSMQNTLLLPTPAILQLGRDPAMTPFGMLGLLCLHKGCALKAAPLLTPWCHEVSSQSTICIVRTPHVNCSACKQL